MPDAAAEGGHKHGGIIIRVKSDTLDVREGEILEEARGKLLNVQELEQMNSRLKADSDTLELDVIDNDGNE